MGGCVAFTNVGPTAIAGANFAGLLMAARLPLQAALIVLCLVAARRVFSTPAAMAD